MTPLEKAVDDLLAAVDVVENRTSRISDKEYAVRDWALQRLWERAQTVRDIVATDSDPSRREAVVDE